MGAASECPGLLTADFSWVGEGPLHLWWDRANLGQVSLLTWRMGT